MFKELELTEAVMDVAKRLMAGRNSYVFDFSVSQTVRGVEAGAGRIYNINKSG